MKELNEKKYQLLLFKVSDFNYAVDIHYLKDVSKGIPITPVPGAGVEVSGISNIKGELITVSTLPPYQGDSSDGAIIRLKNQNQTEAIFCTEVLDIIEVSDDTIEKGETVSETVASALGVFPYSGKTWVLISPEKI
jgi:chemotaxis signal transduction protein